MDTDDLEPRKPIVKPTDLGTLSVDELKTYIQSLETEIKRAQAAIAAKQSHRHGAEAFFKR
ncbi:MAG: DUF1192 domain-containing protein [Alphaproteobacteria bacterium]|nr:DUF1192 domain-containing protein [Alphaproteobacteria bacterium]MBF0356277.1 DUF1192 domain-containing protein [Alphaproteobacteria bacterium]